MNRPAFHSGASADAWHGAAALVGPDELAALYEASATLSRSLDLRHTQEAIVLAARHRFGFDRAGLWLYDPDADCIRGTAGTDETLSLTREDHLAIPFSEIPDPMRSVLIGEIPFYLTQDLQADLPQMAGTENMSSVRANAVIPLQRGDDVLGFLSVDNAVSGRPITEAHVRLLLLFANYAAAALQNALVAEQTREHLAEVELRRRLERKVRRLQQVHTVAAEITSLDLDAVLRHLRNRLVTVFGFDRAGVMLLDPRDVGVLRRTWGSDGEGNLVDEREMPPYRVEEHEDLAAIVSSEEPYLLRHWPQAGEDAAEGEAIPQHALIQLRSSQRLLGVLSVDNILSGHPITEDDIEILLLLAGHASLAIQKAHLYALEQEVNARLRKVLNRERRIANTLQKAFKPSLGSWLYGVRIGHFYRPAMAEADLGGDFYDVLDMGEGKIGLVMADVSGKGLAAAARTARARYALQAFAFEDPDPVRVLERLNRFLYIQTGASEAFLTLFYGVLDSRTGEIRCASAGHEPPALIRKGTPPEFLELPGVPCGIFPEMETEEAVFHLQPGDRFLLYSDGVTEARQGRKLFDFEGLKHALEEEGHRPLDSLVRRIYGRVLRYNGGVMRDDVALLMVEAETPETEDKKSSS